MRLPLSGADYFHHLVHRLIVRHGGPGNCGQLRVPLAGTPDPAAVALAWRRAGERFWTLGGRYRAGLRGAWFAVRRPAALALDLAGEPLPILADRHWRAGLTESGPRARLGLATGAEPGLVLTWDHRLCDARGAMGLIAALPDLAAQEPTAGRAGWRPAGAREPDLPAGWISRGRLARAALPHLGKRGRDALWRPPGAFGNAAAPLVHHALVLDAEASARATARQRAASGRLGETAFFIAGLAAALEDLGGIRGDLLFPLAVDARVPGGDSAAPADLLENRHGFVFLRLPAGLASADLAAAAKHLTQAWRAWLADAAGSKLAAALTFFPLVGERLAAAEIGGGCPGVAASCLVANTGMTLVPDRLFSAGVAGVDHRIAVPAVPGLAVLFHRDRRGLGWDVIAAGEVARTLPPATLAARIRHHLLDRVLLASAAPAARSALPDHPPAAAAPMPAPATHSALGRLAPGAGANP